MINSQPLVSVVTPVHNGEAYLAECIESVTAQTYDNWNYVIVNNCSSDRSLAIAERFAEKDSRIRICDNERFLDVMPNLNHTMRQICPGSKYCKVIHADDWIFPECLERMVEVAERYPSIGIVGAYRLDESRVNLDGLPYPSTIVSGREICRQNLLEHTYVFGSPSSLLIRSDLIRKRDPFYSENSFHADKEVCFDLLKESDFGFVHQVLTFTRRHNESETNFSKSYNTYRIAKLMIMKTYGPQFLDPDEYNLMFRNMVKSYYAYLAKSVFDMKGRDFFRFHKRELKKINLHIRSTKLLIAILKELMNPLDAMRSARDALKKRALVCGKH